MFLRRKWVDTFKLESEAAKLQFVVRTESNDCRFGFDKNLFCREAPALAAVSLIVDFQKVVCATSIVFDFKVGDPDFDVFAFLGGERVLAIRARLVGGREILRSDDAGAGQRLDAGVDWNFLVEALELESETGVADFVIGLEPDDSAAGRDDDVVGCRSVRVLRVAAVFSSVDEKSIGVACSFRVLDVEVRNCDSDFVVSLRSVKLVLAVLVLGVFFALPEAGGGDGAAAGQLLAADRFLVGVADDFELESFSDDAAVGFEGNFVAVSEHDWAPHWSERLRSAIALSSFASFSAIEETHLVRVSFVAAVSRDLTFAGGGAVELDSVVTTEAGVLDVEALRDHDDVLRIRHVDDPAAVQVIVVVAGVEAGRLDRLVGRDGAAAGRPRVRACRISDRSWLLRRSEGEKRCSKLKN